MTRQQALIRARGCGAAPSGMRLVAEHSPGATGSESRWRCKLMIRLLPEEADALLLHAPESIRARLVEIASKP